MRILGASATVLFLLSVGMTAAQEQVVPVDKLPSAVLKAVKKRFPTADLKQAKRVIDDDETTYEVELKLKGKQIDMVLTPEGDITEISIEIDEAKIPKAVAKTLADKYPKASIEDATVVFNVVKGKETLSYFEIEIITTDDRTLILEIAPSGNVRKETRKDKK